MNEILIVSSILFSIGAMGLVMRRNLLFMLLAIEVMFNAAAFAFIGIACKLGQVDGQVMFLLIASVAAAEIGIGLALLMAYERIFKTIDLG